MSWGVIGTGAIAARFAVAAAQVGHPVAAVASRSAATGQDFARRFTIPTTVVGAEELAALPEVSRVYVATPNDRHRADALAGIAAGTAVLCEKPLAVTAGEAREVADAAAEAGVFVMEGLWSLCLPVYRDVIARAAAGEIGEIRGIEASFAVPHRAETMPHLFEGPGSGALLDRGVYLLALTRALLGPDLQLVHAAGDLGPTGTDLAATVILEAPTGARAVLSAAIDRMGGNRMVVAGTGGRIALEEPVTNPNGYRLRRTDPSASFAGPSHLPGARERLTARLAGRPVLRGLAGAVLRRPSGAPGGLEDEITHVEACLAAGRTESDWVPPASSVAVLELIDAARAAIGARS